MELKPNEVIEDLGENFKIIQNKTMFCYGTDASVLSDFIVAKPKEKLIDLCSGNGIIPILLCKKTRCADITALEIQKEVCELTKRSVKLNNLIDKIKVINGDLRKVKDLFSAGHFDVVTCNPPYMPQNTGKSNLSDSVNIARHEIMCTLEDVIISSAYLLKNGGRFYMVHRAERLADIIYLLKCNNLEPKKMTVITANTESEPSLVLIEAQKDRKSGLIITKPIYVNI